MWFDKKRPALGYAKALDIASAVKRIREERVILRDSDGNCVRLRYPDEVVETAARAATRAPDLAASIDLLEQVFCNAEQRVSDAIHTS
jgi:hypothetical protein